MTIGTRPLLAPKRARDVVAVDAGQTDVENEQVGGRRELGEALRDRRSRRRPQTLRVRDDAREVRGSLHRLPRRESFAPACGNECPRRAASETVSRPRHRASSAGERTEARSVLAQHAVDRRRRKTEPFEAARRGRIGDRGRSCATSRSNAAPQRVPSSSSSDATACSAASRVDALADELADEPVVSGRLALSLDVEPRVEPVVEEALTLAALRSPHESRRRRTPCVPSAARAALPCTAAARGTQAQQSRRSRPCSHDCRALMSLAERCRQG